MVYIVVILVLVHSCQSLIMFGPDITTGTAITSEGNVANLFCDVVNLTEDHSISWYRQKPSGAKTVIYRDGKLITTDLGREAQVYRTHSIYDVVIFQAKGENLGWIINGNLYTCEVSLKSTGEIVLVSSGLTTEAHYTPSPVYPICESCQFSSDFIGKSITISCYSEPGKPQVKLTWTKNGKEIENLQILPFNSLIYLNYTFVLNAEDINAIFQCTLEDKQTSRICSISEFSRNCYSEDDNNETSDDSTTTYIIIASIVGGLFLCILFIFLFCKFKNTNQQENPSKDSVRFSQQQGPDDHTYENPGQLSFARIAEVGTNNSSQEDEDDICVMENKSKIYGHKISDAIEDICSSENRRRIYENQRQSSDNIYEI